MNFKEAYCAGRGELADRLIEHIGRGPLAQEALWMTLWSPFHADALECPASFYNYDKWRYKRETIGFETGPARIERIHNAYLRFPVNTGYYLVMDRYKDYDHYFRQLSRKTRRKLRNQDHFYHERGVELAPARSSDDFEKFLTLFSAQWPGDAWANRLRALLPAIYMRFEELGRNHSLLLRDRDGAVIAGLLAYRTDHALNWHLLSRCHGPLDRHAPGIHLVHRAIRRFFEAAEAPVLIYGPGDYEWKRRFLGQPYPVYRYEALTPLNLAGLVGLFVARRRRKKANNEEEASGMVIDRPGALCSIQPHRLRVAGQPPRGDDPRA